MVVVFVAVAILLSAKKQLLSVAMVRDIRHQLDSVRLLIVAKLCSQSPTDMYDFPYEQIHRDNLPLIVNQALEMWESSGSPLEPKI